MKEQILKLRSDGKNYNEIKNILGCSKGTISYHCGNGTHEKTIKRNKNNRNKNPIKTKLDRFKGRRPIGKKLRDFGRRGKGLGLTSTSSSNFNVDDLISKFGLTTKCYLTGEDINLLEVNTYAFDHVIPVSRGGENTLENLKICKTIANKSKTDLLFDEYLLLCKNVLEHNGYNVNKKLAEV